MDVEEILRKVIEGEMTKEDAVNMLRDLPYKDIGFAKIDFQRRLRRGIPEAIFAPGKSLHQITTIVSEMKDKEKIFITKASEEIYEAVKDVPDSRYYKDAHMVIIGSKYECKDDRKVVIVTGGTSDVPVAEEAAVTLEELGIKPVKIYDAGVAGMHRLLSKRETLKQARIVIAVAGMDGILPTLVSNLTSAVVIAVPTSVGYGTGLNGVSALMSMLNSCSPGLLVVNIDNGYGAGIATYLMLEDK
jgi:NCAIR mutase (PurE)-related protein